MMGRGYSLGVLGSILAVAAFCIGLASAGLWAWSDAKWRDHLANSYVAGVSLYASLTSNTPLPNSISGQTLSESAQGLANRGEFAQIPNAPRPSRITIASILEAPSPSASGKKIELAVVAAELQYPLSDVQTGQTRNPAETLGALTRVLASYCSNPVIFARVDGALWQRIDGGQIWGCDAAPKDWRLISALGAIVGLAIIVTLFLDAAGKFTRFAELLRSRLRLGGPDSYETEGPEELRDIVEAVNSYLKKEREQLEKRAMVLSGVSHDLGTPATRLRLRVELIDEPELRSKLEGDIDQLTGIIESVLSYTRAEIGSEEPRQISLTSLVESLVSDYSDTGLPVEFSPGDEEIVTGGSSVFMSRQGRGILPDERRIIVMARPVSLQRALSNLIDNALKYGRRATVKLRADADTAVITVEDEGSEFTPEGLEALIAPYQRGSNTQTIPGFGLGLTIVQSIANMHGGALSFTAGRTGMRANLVIQRH